MKPLLIFFFVLNVIIASAQNNVYEDYRKQQNTAFNNFKKEYYSDISKMDELYQNFIDSENEIYNAYKNLGYVPALANERVESVEKLYPKHDVSIPINESIKNIELALKKWETKKEELTKDNKTKVDVIDIPDEIIPLDNEDKLEVVDIPKDIDITDIATSSITDKELKLEIDANRPVFYPLGKDSYRVSSKFNKKRMHPVLKYVRKHEGVDLAAKSGTKIYAAANGVIKLSKYSRSAGKYAIVNHQNGYTTSYMHMSKCYVKTGDKVKRGQVIGLVGSTGISTGPHLHYEIRKDGTAFDPEPFMIKHFN